LDPRVHMEDRADVRMLAVDLPVLDRVDGDAPPLDAGRDAEDDPVSRGVVARDEEDVSPDGLEPTLVDPARAHPEPGLVPARGEVAVREPADPVQPLDVAEGSLVDEIFDREGRRQAAQVVETPPCGGGPHPLVAAV